MTPDYDILVHSKDDVRYDRSRQVKTLTLEGKEISRIFWPSRVGYHLVVK